VKIGPEKLGHKVPGLNVRCSGQCGVENAHRSSSGEIKTSLRLMICWGACEFVI